MRGSVSNSILFFVFPALTNQLYIILIRNQYQNMLTRRECSTKLPLLYPPPLTVRKHCKRYIMDWQTTKEQPWRDMADAEVNGATDEPLKRATI